MKNFKFILLISFLFYSNSKLYSEISYSDSSASEYFNKGEQHILDGDTLKAIQAFNKAIRYDRKYSNAYLRLAQIYINFGKLEDRIKAKKIINKALRFDPDNESLLLTKLDLFFRTKMYYSARKISQKILEVNPNSARGYYSLGYLREMTWEKYRNMYSSHPGAGITFNLSSFVENDLADAIGYYKKAADLDPNDNNSYYRLAFIFYETNEINQMIDLFQNALNINPDNKNYYLFLGLAYRKKNFLDKAWAEFEKAKSLMQPQELALFESGDLVSEYGKQEILTQTGEQKKIQNRFWKQKDPLFLTEVNERKLEHYCRIAYANLRFSRLQQGIEGWKTPQGQVLIRYGSPTGNSKSWATINAAMAGFPVNFSNEVWSYPGFIIRFEDKNLDGVYEFYNKDSYNTVVKKQPEMFDFIRPNKRILVSCSVADFQYKDNLSSVEVYQNIIQNQLVDKLETRKKTIKRGVYIFDKDWKEVRSIVSSHPNYFSYHEMLVSWNQMQLPPGEYNLVVEFMDQETGMIGRWRQYLTIEAYNKQDLAISDIVLAWNFGDIAEARMLQKNNIGIIPNAVGVYVDKPVAHIYFEIYNLYLTVNGKSNYRVTFTIEPDKNNKNRIGQFVQKLFGKDNESEQVAISTDYTGKNRNDFIYHTLTLAKPQPGKYHLKIEVLDLNNNEKTVKKRMFTLKENVK